MKTILTSGPVIIENGKLLVNKDDKDDFYKLPGGTVEKGESLAQACKNESRQENNAKIKIIKPLNPMVIYKNPQTNEEIKQEKHKVAPNIKFLIEKGDIA